MRDVNRYKAVQGRLRPDLLDRPKRTGQPFSRTVLESGTAQMTVYLSKAPAHLSQEDLEKAVDARARQMRKELQSQDKLVTREARFVTGADGDVKIIMEWKLLGNKPTKYTRPPSEHVRKTKRRYRINAGNVAAQQGRQGEP